MSTARPESGLRPLEARLLIATVLVLLVVDLGLFLRVNQLQERILGAIETGALASGTARRPGLEAGVPAPELALRTPDGEPVSLREFQGSEVLVMFSSVTCPACQTMYPELARFAERNPDLPVLMISNGTPAENRAVAAEHELGVTMAQWDGQTAHDYRVPGTPFFYLVDERGVIRRSGFASSAQDLAELTGSGPAEVALHRHPTRP
ncbi:MAG: TlpA disulfide reductase family protein [Acidobacteriota bacterium]|jgi:methylamine dehydrogenase accessory protein MauD